MQRKTTVIFFSMLSLLVWGNLFGCRTMVDIFAFYPDKSHVMAADELPDGVEEISLTTDDGVQIVALYLPNPSSDKALIYFHGNANTIYQRLPGLQRLQAMGLNVIGVSYRGYGKSTGSPSEQGVYRDGQAVIQYAIHELGFAESRLLLLGRSIGTTVAVHSAQNRDIAALILVSPLTHARAQAKASGIGLLAPLAGDAFNNLGKIENTRAPLLIIHGSRDRIIPLSMGQELFQRYQGQKKWVAIEGAGHNDLQSRYAQQYWSAISDFIAGL